MDSTVIVNSHYICSFVFTLKAFNLAKIDFIKNFYFPWELLGGLIIRQFRKPKIKIIRFSLLVFQSVKPMWLSRRTILPEYGV